MPAAPAAPPSPPPSAPAQPAQSAPSPVTPTKATVVTPPKTAPAPSALSTRPSRRGVQLPKEQPQDPEIPDEALDTIEGSFAGIKKLGKRDDGQPEEVEQPSAKPDEQKSPDKQDVEQAQEDEAQVTDEQEKAVEEAQSQDPKLGKKPSPWKLVEHYKSHNSNLQREIAELRSKGAEPPKEVSERLSAVEKRNQELEQHIRFVDYSKSQEFVDKYQKPYEEAWTRAIGGLKGLSLKLGTDPNTGQEMARELTPQDIAALANMDPASARMEIKNRFPDDVAEVRGYVDKIRDLASAQNQALEEHKTKGSEWQNQQVQKHQQINEVNTRMWAQFSKEAAEKHQTLQPIEGDDERNMKLEKATAFVHRALAAKANDPNLTDEQRADVIRQHVAVRNRAIAYSVLMHENKALKAQLAEREESLKAFESSSPTDGNGKGKTSSGAEALSIDGVAAMLSKLGR